MFCVKILLVLNCRSKHVMMMNHFNTTLINIKKVRQKNPKKLYIGLQYDNVLLKIFIKVIKETHNIWKEIPQPETLNVINAGNNTDVILVSRYGIRILLGDGIFFLFACT